MTHAVRRSSGDAAQFTTGSCKPPRINAAPIVARDRIKGTPDPPWVIAVAMAVFFGFTALLMMFA